MTAPPERGAVIRKSDRTILGSRARMTRLRYCERDGSLDSNIKNEAPNAVVELAGELPHLQAVVCNGGKAGAAFKKYFAKKMPERVQIFYLPSTSPANARLRLEGLAERWRVILQFLT